MSDRSDRDTFDEALIGSAFAQVAERGWRALNLADAARDAGLALDETRRRFPDTTAVLVRLGTMADEAALNETTPDVAGPAKGPRELLFDMLMRRFDVLQQHREGVVSLLHAIPADPGLALMLAGTTARSMGWMLAGAGIAGSGLRGFVRVNLLSGAWLGIVRAWERDQSPDLSATMAALDRTLDRLARIDPAFGAAPVDGIGPGGGPAPSDDLSDVVIDADAPYIPPEAASFEVASSDAARSAAATEAPYAPPTVS